MAPPLPTIVVICGRRRVGKDALAEQLVEHHGYRRVAVAQSLKLATCMLFGMAMDVFESDRKDAVDPTWGMTPRQILQHFGQDMKARFGQDFWMRHCLSDIARALQFGAPGVVVSDVRFPFEADAIRQAYGCGRCRVMRVVRDGGLRGEVDDHVTETSQEGIDEDHIIRNSGTIEDMYQCLVAQCMAIL